jgi:hypothetical protein
MSEWFSKLACISSEKLIKTHQTNQSNQNQKNKNKNKKIKIKGSIYIVYKGKNQAKYLFRAWPFTG